MNSSKTPHKSAPKRAKVGIRSYLPSLPVNSTIGLIAGFFLVIVSLFIAAWAIDDARHDGKVARNVSVSGINVGGLSPSDLVIVLNAISAEYDSTPVVIRTSDGEIETTAGVVGIGLDAESTAQEVLSVGGGSFISEPFRWVQSLFDLRASKVVVYLRSGMSEEFKSLVIAQQPDPIEPKWALSNGEVAVIPGVPASAFDLETIQYDVLAAATAGENPIKVNAQSIEILPLISNDEAEAFAKSVNDLTSSGLEVVVGGRSHLFRAEDLRGWMSFNIVSGSPTYEFNDSLIIGAIGRELGGVVADSNEDPQITVVDGKLTLVNLSAKACCSAESPALIIEAIEDGRERVTLDLIDISDGADELLAAFGVTELISQATTHHPCCASRVANIHRFAELMQGTIIKPGEALSLNGTVGERTEAKGFVEAGVIVNGELTEDVGGGISQFATTFFQASFYGGLDIEQFFPHTIWFSRYTDFAGRKGIESTISWPSPDVRVRNTSPYPILIWPTWTHTSVTVSLYSTRYAEVDVERQDFRMSEECEIIETTRIRIYPDSSEQFDKFVARYQPENGIGCDGEPTYPRPPDPPVDVIAISGDGQVTVSWGIPEPEGDFDITEYFPIEEYVVISDPGEETCSIAPPELSCTVEGLSNGTSYTFTVIAVNSEGDSEASEPSESVIPVSAPEPTPTPEPTPEPTPTPTPSE